MLLLKIIIIKYDQSENEREREDRAHYSYSTLSEYMFDSSEKEEVEKNSQNEYHSP